MATEVLSNFEQGQLYKMVRQEGLRGEDDDSSKKLVESLREAIEEIGINRVTEAMKKEALSSLIDTLKLDVHIEKPAKTASKAVVRKRIASLVAEEGLSKFFSKMADEDLDKFFDAVPTEEEKDEGKKKYGPQVARTIAEVGLHVFFGRFDVGFLQDLMETCKLKYNTSNLNALASALATQTSAQKEKKRGATTNKTPKFSKEKQPIKKGITYQDIYQHYYSDDLQKYCKENDIKHSGSKKDLIKRILAYLEDPDDESVKAGYKASPKRKRSSSASRTKKTTKKSGKKEEAEDDKEEDEKEAETKADKSEKKTKESKSTKKSSTTKKSKGEEEEK